MKESSLLAWSEPLQPSVLNPDQLAQQVAAEFRPAAVRKGLELAVEPSLDWHDVVGDEPKIRQILARLLANAIRYTPNGCVRVTIKPSDGEYWGVTVEDTGGGMTLEEARHAFDESYSARRAAPASRKDRGLTVSKRLIEQMQGKISLRSVAGKGTRVEVRLPVMMREPGSGLHGTEGYPRSEEAEFAVVAGDGFARA